MSADVSLDVHPRARICLVPRSQVYPERERDVYLDVQASHMADLLLEHAFEKDERAWEWSVYKLERESGVAPELSLRLDEDLYAFGVDALASP